MSLAAPTRVDVAIVGGGMVGATVALALAGTPLRVALVEAVRFDAAEQSSFDDRTTALGNGSRRILETLGAWPLMAAHASPVSEIHVSEAGRYGGARLRAAEQGLEALGYLVSNRHIGAALWQLLVQQPALQLRVPVRVHEAQFEADCVRLRLAPPAATPGMAATPAAQECIETRVVIAADGAQSLLARTAGIAHDVEDYQQVAVVVHVSTDRAASGVAHERFTPSGPLAVLPLRDGRHTIVWTLAPERAQAVLALEDAAFISELQQCFGWRIGRMLAASARASYPLRLSRAGSMRGPRLALVGNAAQALHPVAGQGFNLGLRDAALLAELLAAAKDPGDPAVLEDYQRRRATDRRGMIGFTDGLVQMFGSDRALVVAVRSLGLQLFDLMPAAKRALSALSWGFGGDTPRLMRGLRLNPRPGNGERP
jgi:2-octaprenyl-6-methoxyphenol hydroxylase